MSEDGAPRMLLALLLCERVDWDDGATRSLIRTFDTTLVPSFPTQHPIKVYVKWRGSMPSELRVDFAEITTGHVEHTATLTTEPIPPRATNDYTFDLVFVLVAPITYDVRVLADGQMLGTTTWAVGPWAP